MGYVKNYIMNILWKVGAQSMICCKLSRIRPELLRKDKTLPAWKAFDNIFDLYIMVSSGQIFCILKIFPWPMSALPQLFLFYYLLILYIRPLKRQIEHFRFPFLHHCHPERRNLQNNCSNRHIVSASCVYHWTSNWWPKIRI